MIIEERKAELRLPKGFINLEDPCLSSSVMDMRTRKNLTPIQDKNTAPLVGGMKIDYRRSLSQSHGKRMFPMSYFSLESLLLLVCLTASLLILPLILPPLPPPPFMLLLLPICILALLMILAFTPSNVRDMTYTYV